MPAGEFPAGLLDNMAKRAKYVGSPYHKKSPGDYGLVPPFAPRPGATLCDGDGQEIKKTKALRMLRKGIRLGLVSQQQRNGWPQNVWMVQDGEAYEAQLQNEDNGEYHGYPLSNDDDFGAEVLNAWNERRQTHN